MQVLTNLAVRQNANAPPRDSCREQIRANERTKKRKLEPQVFSSSLEIERDIFSKCQSDGFAIVRQKTDLR